MWSRFWYGFCYQKLRGALRHCATLSLNLPIGAQSSAMLGPIRAMLPQISMCCSSVALPLPVNCSGFRSCTSFVSCAHMIKRIMTPNAATVSVTRGRVSLSPCTALWSMKIKKIFLEPSSATLPGVTDTVAALGVPSHGVWRNVLTPL